MIGVEGDDRKENHAFLTLAKHMKSHGLRVPEVVAAGEDELTYLQEDLGGKSLYDHISACQKSGVWDEETRALLRQVMTDLPAIQFLTADGYDFCHDVAKISRLDRMAVMWDLNYFKYCFLKPTDVAFDEQALELDFERLCDLLLSGGEGKPSPDRKAFLYRDFQSRNVMVREGVPYYIDFQGGFEGPIYYDVASFLWQARAAYPEALKQELLTAYIDALQPYCPMSAEAFQNQLRPFVFFRQIQVLGAYGYRGLFEKKAMFISPIRQALENVVAWIDSHPDLQNGCPELTRVIREVARLERFRSDDASKDRLTVKIVSFSYKKGLPDDYSGNGGGFVFDCRAPHNPGRYAEYKQKTGLEQEVIDFLEGRVHAYDDKKLGTELSMPEYMEHVYALVDPAVETYLKRGFTSLMVCFGCTGGQHRSVYGAQHLAEHLSRKFPAAIIDLWHREQGIRQTL